MKIKLTKLACGLGIIQPTCNACIESAVFDFEILNKGVQVMRGLFCIDHWLQLVEWFQEKEDC